MPIKLTLEEVKKISLKNGFEFLDNNYVNINFKHMFKCLKHKEIYKSSVGLIKLGNGLTCCREESYRQNGIKQRIPLEEIKKRSLEKGFEFLDNEYFGNKYKHNFRCLIDNETHLKSWNGLKDEGLKCCQRRKLSKMFGENNNAWKKELTEQDRIERKRKNAEDIKWKKFIKKRDNYKCVLCNSTTKIHAHHLESWAKNKKLRCDINNGVTLCSKHHFKLHKLYGKFTTKKQYLEFRRKYDS